MKYTFYVFITTQLFMVTPCNTMEKPERIELIMTLTHVKNPLKAQYITQDSIAISSNRACKIVHTNTDTIIDIPLKHDPDMRFAGIQKNSNKIAFSSQNSIKTCSTGKRSFGIMIQNIIDIYDTNDGKRLHTIMAKNPPISPIFSSSDNTVFLGYKAAPYGIIEKYNHATGLYTEYIFPTLACFTCHPTKKQLCIACNGEKPIIYNVDNYDNFTVGKTMPLSDLMAHTNSYTFCEYSPNGFSIAIGNSMFVYIWNLRTDKASMLPAVERENIQKIAFHPNNIILALLSTCYYPCSIIRYWDLRTRKPITEIPLQNVGHDLSFSHDGKKIVITLEKKCVVYSVPPEVTNPEEVS